MREVAVEKTRPDGVLPEKQHPGDHGWDLRAVHFPDMQGDMKSVELGSGHVVRVGTGFRLELPDELEFEIRSRSGLSMKGLVVANAPGTIDSGYRNEIFVILANIGWGVVTVENGMRVAQGVFKEVPPDVTIVERDVGLDTVRGQAGVGSTGVG